MKLSDRLQTVTRLFLDTAPVDAFQVAIALTTNCDAFLTNDIMKLFALASGNQHFGIIIAARRSPHEVARRLAVLLNALTADELENQLFYV